MPERRPCGRGSKAIFLMRAITLADRWLGRAAADHPRVGRDRSPSGPKLSAPRPRGGCRNGASRPNKATDRSEIGPYPGWIVASGGGPETKTAARIAPGGGFCNLAERTGPQFAVAGSSLLVCFGSTTWNASFVPAAVTSSVSPALMPPRSNSSASGSSRNFSTARRIGRAP